MYYTVKWSKPNRPKNNLKCGSECFTITFNDNLVENKLDQNKQIQIHCCRPSCSVTILLGKYEPYQRNVNLLNEFKQLL